MRNLPLACAITVSATSVLLLTAGAGPALATYGSEHEVALHQEGALPISADDPEFALEGEECPEVAPGFDGWHFVLPGSTTAFVELRVTFETGGEQVVTDFGPPTDKHAYVSSVAGDALVAASATVNGELVDFRLSHTCPAMDAPVEDPAGDPAEDAEDAADDQPVEAPETTPADEPAPDATTPNGRADEAVAGGEEGESTEDPDLAETGSNTPVVALTAGATILLAAGGYLALRRRRAAAQD